MRSIRSCLSGLLIAVVVACSLTACHVSGEQNVPYIGENGNWWIGSMDSGVTARGEKGNPGAAGAPGEKGDKGDPGDTGRVGFVVGDETSLLAAARVPHAYIMLSEDINLEHGVIEANVRSLSFVLDLNGYTLSGSLLLRAVAGQSLSAIMTNGTLSASVRTEGDAVLTTDVGQAVAATDTALFPSLAEALDAASDGATVRLLRNSTDIGLTVPVGKSLTLDLGGYTYRVGQPVFLPDGTACGLFIPQGGCLTVRNGAIVSSAVQTCVRNHGDLTVENAALSGGSLATLSIRCGETNVSGNTTLDAETDALAVDIRGSNEALTLSFDKLFSGFVSGGIRIQREPDTIGHMELTILGNGRFTQRVSYDIPRTQTGCKLDLSGWRMATDFSELYGQANKVILFIGDGMGDNHIYNTQVRYGRGMFMNTLGYAGHISTSSNDPWVTDSAAAGSALATGHKHNNGEIAQHGGTDTVSIAERAKAAGYGVAIVTTDLISGATPAAFSGHAPSREHTAAIISSQIVGCADLLMGQGDKAYTDARERFEAGGFTFFTAMSQLDMSVTRLIASFPSTSAENGTDTAPTLKMMTEFAVAYMETHFPNGYLLVVEGAYIDKCSHNHDLNGMMSHLRNFDEAVESVCRSLEAQPGVAVIVTADHETGGLKAASDAGQLTRALYTESYHTSADVPYFIRLLGRSPVSGSVFPERMDNTDVNRLMQNLMGLKYIP